MRLFISKTAFSKTALALFAFGAMMSSSFAQNPIEELKRRAQHHQARPQQAAPAPAAPRAVQAAPRVFQAAPQAAAPQYAPRPQHQPRPHFNGGGGGFGGGFAPSAPVIVDRPVYYEQPPQYYQQQPQYYTQQPQYEEEPRYYGRPRYKKRRAACRTVVARDAYGHRYRVKRCAPRARYYRT
jgi:hypothetical protein